MKLTLITLAALALATAQTKFTEIDGKLYCLDDLPADILDGDDVDDADNDPTNELYDDAAIQAAAAQNAADIAAIQAAPDNIDDADADPTNELSECTSGAGAPTAAAKQGDLYVDNVTGSLYIYDGTTWKIGCEKTADIDATLTEDPATPGTYFWDADGDGATDLTITTGSAAIPTALRPHSGLTQGQITSADDVALTESIYHEADGHYNMSQADATLSNSEGFAFSVGDTNGKDDVLIENGRIEHNVPQPMVNTGTVNAATQRASSEFIYRGENDSNFYVTTPYEDTTWQHNNHAESSDRTTWDGRSTRFRLDNRYFQRLQWGDAQYRSSGVAVIQQYQNQSDSYSLAGHRFEVSGASVNKGSNQGRFYVQHSAGLAITNPTQANGGIDPVWGAYTNPVTNIQLNHFFNAPATGGGTGGGAYIGYGTNGTVQVSTKLTSHDAGIVEILQGLGAINADLPSEYVSLNISIFPEDRVLVVEKGDAVYLQADIVTGDYKLITTDGTQTASDEYFTNFKGICNLGLKDTDESWAMSNDDRKAWAYDNTRGTTYKASLANTAGEEVKFEIGQEQLPEELQGLESYTVTVIGGGESDNDEYLTIDGQTVKGLPKRVDLLSVKSLTGVSLTGIAPDVDGGESYTLIISQ